MISRSVQVVLYQQQKFKTAIVTSMSAYEIKGIVCMEKIVL